MNWTINTEAGTAAIIIRYLFYISIPICFGILIFKLVCSIRNKNRTGILKAALILAFLSVFVIFCFVSSDSLPTAVKTSDISSAAAEFEKYDPGNYEFSFGFCQGIVFVSKCENQDEAEKMLASFAEYNETKIVTDNGVKFSKTLYECTRADIKYGGFLAGITDSHGAWVGVAGENRYIRIFYSYFDSGVSSVFRGLIPLDMIIRPKLNLLKVSSNMRLISQENPEENENIAQTVKNVKIGYLPNGFELTDTFNYSDVSVDYNYCIPNSNSRLCFHICSADEGKIFVENIETKYTKSKINGHDAWTHYEENDGSCWGEMLLTGSKVSVQFYGHLSQSELMKVAQNLVFE